MRTADRAKTLRLGLLWLCLGPLGCHRSQDVPPMTNVPCTEGRTLACACEDGRAGASRCEAGGRWGACVCAPGAVPAPTAGCEPTEDVDGALLLLCPGQAWRAPIDAGTPARCELRDGGGYPVFTCGDAEVTLDAPHRPVGDSGVEEAPLLTLEGSVTVRNDLDAAFVASFERIDGDLVLEGTTVDLFALPSLREIGGRLRIANNRDLSEVSLPALELVEDAVEIDDNPLLQALALPRLTVAASLAVASTPLLDSLHLPLLRGSDSMTVILSGDMRVTLPRLSLLASLSVACVRELRLAPAAAVATMSMAEDGCDPTAADWAPALYGVDVVDSLELGADTLPWHVRAPGLRHVGALDVRNRDQPLSLDFPLLAELGTVQFRSTVQTELNCAVSWPRVTRLEALHLSDNAALERIDCPGLTEVDALSFSSNAALTSIDLSGLLRVDTALLSGNELLPALVLPSLGQATGVTITSHATLASVELSGLTNVTRWPAIYDNPGLTSLDLSGLGVGPGRVHYGDVSLDTEAQVVAFQAASPRYVAGALRASATALEEISLSFSEPLIVGRYVSIEDNPKLERIAFRGLLETSSVTIKHNDVLRQVGLPTLARATLTISGHPELADLEAAAHAGPKFVATDNELLSRIALPKLRITRYNLTVARNPRLRSLDIAPAEEKVPVGICDNALLPQCYLDALNVTGNGNCRKNGGSSSCEDACCEGVAP